MKREKVPQSRAFVLMYHRIATVSSDPWRLAVSPANFEEHLQILKKYYQVIPVKEVVEHLNKGTIPANSVCLTFDDGYADNYLNALPLLEKYNCPATFFIVTGFVDRKQHFWWDTLANVLLDSERLPDTFSIDLPDQDYTAVLNDETELTPELRRKHRLWHYPAPPPSRRAGIYLAIYEKMKALSPVEQEGVARHFRALQPDQTVLDEQLPVSEAQLLRMDQHALADIGLHTHSHPALGVQSAARQQAEIESCANCLKEMAGHYIPVISYPHGHYNQQTLKIAKEQRLLAGFTTEELAVTPQTDPYRMGRFQIGDWDGETFHKRLFQWMGRRS